MKHVKQSSDVWKSWLGTISTQSVQLSKEKSLGFNVVELLLFNLNIIIYALYLTLEKWYEKNFFLWHFKWIVSSRWPGLVLGLVRGQTKFVEPTCGTLDLVATFSSLVYVHASVHRYVQNVFLVENKGEKS